VIIAHQIPSSLISKYTPSTHDSSTRVNSIDTTDTYMV
jgi:hypothetical protein